MSRSNPQPCRWDFPPTTRGELRCVIHGDAHSRIVLYPDLACRPSTMRSLYLDSKLEGEALLEAQGLVD